MPSGASAGRCSLPTVVMNLLSLALPLAILKIYDRIVPAGAVETLIVLLLGVAVVLLLEGMLTQLRAVLVGWTAARQEHALAGALFDRLMAASPAALRREGPGSSLERFASLQRLKDSTNGLPPAILADVPFVLLFVGMMAIVAGWLAVLPVAIAILALSVLLVEDRRVTSWRRGDLDLRARRLNFLTETMDRIGAIKAAGLENLILRRFERLTRSSCGIERRLARRGAVLDLLPSLMNGASLLATTSAGALLVMQGAMSLGELAACTLLSNRAMLPLQRLVASWNTLREQRIRHDRVEEGLALPREREPDLPSLPRLQGSVRLEDLLLRGGGRDQTPLLDRFDLSVRPGELLGVTGPAGSGKTRLLLVMAAFERPDAGRVLLDERYDPWSFDEDSLREQVVLVSGAAPIFSGTLLENMTGFAPPWHARQKTRSPSLDRARALALADRFGLTDFVGRLPRGFDTPVGPGSAYALSAGIAQRVALLRAFYMKPAILLLDGANAALDSTGDGQLLALLKERRGLVTQIIATQRPSILRQCDRVIVLPGGLEERPRARLRVASASDQG